MLKLLQKMPRNGIWVPISIAAMETGYSYQMIRYLYNNDKITAIKIAKTPIMVNIEDIPKKT